MNKIDFLISSYEVLHNRKGIPPFLFTPFRRILRLIARNTLPNWLESEEYGNNVPKSDIIVSLTSFPARINDVHLVIRCFLRQTVLPQKILLWLSKEQFEGVEIPENLESLQNDIFEIRFVDGDIRSHKKYFYVLGEFPEDKILLVDDDIFYPSTMIQELLDAYNSYPNYVICRYGSLIKFSGNEPNKFHTWWWEIAEECNNQDFFFGSGGGTLISRNLLYEDIINIDLARQLTPIADDIWLNAMVNLKGTKKYKVKCGLLLQNEDQQTVRLTSENTGKNLNDVQFKNVIAYYKEKINKNPFGKRAL